MQRYICIVAFNEERNHCRGSVEAWWDLGLRYFCLFHLSSGRNSYHAVPDMFILDSLDGIWRMAFRDQLKINFSLYRTRARNYLPNTRNHRKINGIHDERENVFSRFGAVSFIDERPFIRNSNQRKSHQSGILKDLRTLVISRCFNHLGYAYSTTCVRVAVSF